MSGVFDDQKIGMSDLLNSASDRDNSEFSALLEKHQQSTMESKLQIARIGGYTKRSVEDFVLEMRHNLLQVKTQLEQQIMVLASEKASVAQECNVLRKQLKTAVETLSIRNQPAVQYDGELTEAEQEMMLYREENERLRSMLLDSQPNQNEKERYEALLQQKESEITQLNEKLIQYMDQCNALKEKTEQLENIIIDSSAADQEIAELKQQKDEIEGKYQELLSNIEKTNAEYDAKKQQLDERETQLDEKKNQLDERETQFDEKKHQLDERETQLDEKKHQLDERETQLDERQKYLDELQKQLEQEKAYLMEAQAQMEEKKQYLDELQIQIEQEKTRLAENIAQLEIKDQQLTEIRAQLESELKAREYIGHMMTKDFGDNENWATQEGRDDASGERLFEELYVHFSQLRGKVEQQQAMITEKDTLLEQLKNLEKETIALREENESAKATISSLKKSFEQVMGELDEQTEMLNVYVARSRKDREMLKTALCDRSTTKLDPEGSETQLSSQQSEIDELEEENAKLEEAVIKPYSQILRFEDARIIPLNDKGHMDEDADMVEYSAMADMTKVADI